MIKALEDNFGQRIEGMRLAGRILIINTVDTIVFGIADSFVI